MLVNVCFVQSSILARPNFLRHCATTGIPMFRQNYFFLSELFFFVRTIFFSMAIGHVGTRALQTWEEGGVHCTDHGALIFSTFYASTAF